MGQPTALDVENSYGVVVAECHEQPSPIRRDCESVWGGAGGCVRPRAHQHPLLASRRVSVEDVDDVIVPAAHEESITRDEHVIWMAAGEHRSRDGERRRIDLRDLGAACQRYV